MSNKFLSLEWFKSKVETSIDRVIASKIESLIQEENQVESQQKYVKPYFSMKMVNNVLTVVLNDGAILSKPNCCEEDYYAVVDSKSVEEILAIMSSSEVIADVQQAKAEAARIKALQKGIELLADLPDFTVEGNTVYLTGTSRSLPQLLVEKFIEVVDRVGQQMADERTFEQALNDDDEYVASKNFFMWCCLNPRAEVAHELYRFLAENSFRITRQGFVVALRNVVTLHGSPELVHFVSNTYNKVKAVWKKNPNEYTVFLENGEYKLVHDDKFETCHEAAQHHWHTTGDMEKRHDQNERWREWVCWSFWFIRCQLQHCVTCRERHKCTQHCTVRRYCTLWATSGARCVQDGY